MRKWNAVLFQNTDIVFANNMILPHKKITHYLQITRNHERVQQGSWIANHNTNTKALITFPFEQKY